MIQRGQTLQAKVSSQSLVKPGELIDVVESVPLKLQDKRLFNELLANAWNDIGEGKEHRIHKSDLTHNDRHLGRLDDSLDRLMGTFIKSIVVRDGEKHRTRFHFLARIDDPYEDPDGFIKYRFSEDAEKMMLNSTVFARIQRDVMFALSSRYSLALYEILAKRINLKHTQSEMFEVDMFRAMLGVPDGKYKLMAHLRSRILDTAFGEVGQLTNIGCSYEMIRTRGKSFTHIKVTWFQKDKFAAYDAERNRQKPKGQQMAEREEHAAMLRSADAQLRKHRNRI
jgi:plasmid replication initiation protein